MDEPIRVLIVDEDDLFRQKTCTLLQELAGMAVVGEARDEQEAVELAHQLQPDVVLLGVDGQHVTCLEVVTGISEQCPGSKIIVLGEAEQEHLLLDALRRGAQGCLSRGRVKPFEMVEAIRAVSEGEPVLSPLLTGLILDEITILRSER